MKKLLMVLLCLICMVGAMALCACTGEEQLEYIYPDEVGLTVRDETASSTQITNDGYVNIGIKEVGASWEATDFFEPQVGGVDREYYIRYFLNDEMFYEQKSEYSETPFDEMGIVPFEANEDLSKYRANRPSFALLFTESDVGKSFKLRADVYFFYSIETKGDTKVEYKKLSKEITLKVRPAFVNEIDDSYEEHYSFVGIPLCVYDSIVAQSSEDTHQYTVVMHNGNDIDSLTLSPDDYSTFRSKYTLGESAVIYKNLDSSTATFDERFADGSAYLDLLDKTFEYKTLAQDNYQNTTEDTYLYNFSTCTVTNIKYWSSTGAGSAITVYYEPEFNPYPDQIDRDSYYFHINYDESGAITSTSFDYTEQKFVSMIESLQVGDTFSGSGRVWTQFYSSVGVIKSINSLTVVQTIPHITPKVGYHQNCDTADCDYSITMTLKDMKDYLTTYNATAEDTKVIVTIEGVDIAEYSVSDFTLNESGEYVITLLTMEQSGNTYKFRGQKNYAPYKENGLGGEVFVIKVNYVINGESTKISNGGHSAYTPNTIANKATSN